MCYGIVCIVVRCCTLLCVLVKQQQQQQYSVSSFSPRPSIQHRCFKFTPVSWFTPHLTISFIRIFLLIAHFVSLSFRKIAQAVTAAVAGGGDQGEGELLLL
jgi:hypothetical protein